MFLIILVYLNLVACVWIKILSVQEKKEPSEEIAMYDEEDGSGANLNDWIPLPEKLKFTQEEFEQGGDAYKYNIMLFMTLFNILGNDISPTKPLVFWVSALLMLTGFISLVIWSVSSQTSWTRSTKPTRTTKSRRTTRWCSPSCRTSRCPRASKTACTSTLSRLQ